jgi:hypothetical protein
MSIINSNNMYVGLALCVIALAACETTEVQDGKVGDRMKVCGAGFSVDTQAALTSTINKATLEGKLDGDLKEEARTTIFSQLPAEYRLKGYEDYISCVEKNWNFDK